MPRKSSDRRAGAISPESHVVQLRLNLAAAWSAAVCFSIYHVLIPFRRCEVFVDRVNGFEYLRKEAPRVFVFRCTHFDWETRSCDSYGARPGMCRDYPRALLWQTRPELLAGCGYRPIDANAQRFLDELERQELTPEQRQKLARDLFLKQ